MRCLTSKETESLYLNMGFKAATNQSWYGRSLMLTEEIASRQMRIGGTPTVIAPRLGYFAESLNRWLPTNCGRLLWISHFSTDFLSSSDFVMAARIGLGETRSLADAPGHQFDSFDYNERDQSNIPLEQIRQIGILAALVCHVIIDGWDAWLISDNSADRIEFWEGNIFFYSIDSLRLREAEALLAEFGCSRDLS